MRSAPEAVAALLAELAPVLGDRLTTNAAILEAHGRDESWHEGASPDAVVFPITTEEVAWIVRACAGHRVPVIPFGVGTSLEGHVSAPFGGVSLDLSRMDRVLSVNDEDLDVWVEAGVTRKALNAHLRDRGLFFPIDPGADATLGGMAATRASGTNAVRYGTMREAVLGLTAVMADGSVVRIARRARKSSAGYDLVGLLVGSEGTLGVITEVCVRLHGIPETVVSGVIDFPDVASAVDTVIATIQLGLPIARIELLDHAQVVACNRYAELTLAERPTLFVEFHGAPAAVAEEVARFEEVARGFGAGPLAVAAETEARNRLWTARHNALYAAKALAPGKRVMITDVCVPISRLADCIAETQADVTRSGLLAPIAGHVGDGNFHLFLLFDSGDPEEFARARQVHDRMVVRALDMEGTCTGEHGIGVGKRAYLAKEQGESGLQLMRSIKAALDPLNTLNPGKVI